MEVKNKKKAILAASVAGILAITGFASTSTLLAAEEAKVMCSGINSCKGTGECGGKGHGCAGKNACKGEGWVSVKDAAECTEKGGKVVEGM